MHQKLYVLYSLVEWQLQDSSAVKLIVDTYNIQDGLTAANPIIAHPVGTDSKKRTYWQFGGKWSKKWTGPATIEC